MYYRGKLIDDMTRDELIEAVKHLGGLYSGVVDDLTKSASNSIMAVDISLEERCIRCGSQRCTGPDSPFASGCRYIKKRIGL